MTMETLIYWLCYLYIYGCTSDLTCICFRISHMSYKPTSQSLTGSALKFAGKLTSHLVVLQEAAKVAQEKKLQQGARLALMPGRLGLWKLFYWGSLHGLVTPKHK